VTLTTNLASTTLTHTLAVTTGWIWSSHDARENGAHTTCYQVIDNLRDAALCLVTQEDVVMSYLKTFRTWSSIMRPSGNMLQLSIVGRSWTNS